MVECCNSQISSTGYFLAKNRCYPGSGSHGAANDGIGGLLRRAANRCTDHTANGGTCHACAHAGYTSYGGCWRSGGVGCSGHGYSGAGPDSHPYVRTYRDANPDADGHASIDSYSHIYAYCYSISYRYANPNCHAVAYADSYAKLG